MVFDAVCYGQPVPGDHGGYEDEQVDGRVHQGDLLPPQQEEGALHRALGPEEVSSWSVELETKAIRRFPKVSIVCYSRPSLMIIASRSQFHVYLPWGQRPFSIVS